MEVKQAIATVAVAFSSSYSSVRHRKCAVGTQRWSWRLFAPTADIKPVLGAAKKQQRIFKWKNWGAGGCDGMTWGFLWRFWRRLVTSSISGMRSIRICCKQSSTNLIVSLQNCRRVSRLCTQRNFNVIVNLGSLFGCQPVHFDPTGRMSPRAGQELWIRRKHSCHERTASVTESLQFGCLT